MHPQNVVFLGLGAVLLVFVWIVILFNPWGWEFMRKGRGEKRREEEDEKIRRFLLKCAEEEG